MPKKDTENVKVTTASIVLTLKERWLKLEASRSFKSFNAYIDYVVTQDIEEREKLERLGVIVRPPQDDPQP